MIRQRKNWVLAFAFMALALLATPVVAQVSLPVANLGSTSFEDGVAGPGWAFEQYVNYGYAGKIKDSNGNSDAGTNHLTTDVFLEHVVYYSTHKVLGGFYGGEALLPFVDVNLESAQAGNNHNRGLGDLTISPLMLVWTPRPIAGGRLFAHRFTADIVLPSGKYSKYDVVNPSNHVVSFNPWYAFTLYPKKHSTKFEISSRIHYLWNSENDDPFVGYGFKSIQPGQAFHENYAASYEVAKGIRIGFNGYAIQQITDHKINGQNVSDSRERLFGSGPGVQFGSRGLWFYANAYFESGAENRAQGIHFNFRVLKTFGGQQGPPPAPGPGPVSAQN
jgi:hypothetical protein